MKKNLIVISPACHTSINRKIYDLYKNENWNVTIIIPSSMRFNNVLKTPDPEKIGGCKIILLDSTSENPRIVYFKGIIKVLNQLKPDIVLIDMDPLNLLSLIIGIKYQFTKVKIFAITCENLSINVLETIKRRGFSSIAASFFKNTFARINRYLLHGVFTINIEGTKIYNELGFKNVNMIPLGFDPTLFNINESKRNEIRKKLNIEGAVISFLGRLIYEKGVHVLLESLNNLKEYNWTLVLDKFSEYKSDYIDSVNKYINDNGLLDRIVFIDPTHDEMGLFINAVDVVVIPSLSTNYWIEQYGRIAAEALACGKFVISSKTGTLPLLINEYGILFEEGSVQELTEILRKYLLHVKLMNHNREEISEYAHKFLSIHSQKYKMDQIFLNVK